MRLLVPSYGRAYRTRDALAVRDARGAHVGTLPSGTLVLSKYTLESGDHGWWALVPVSFGDAPDARTYVVETERPSPVSLADMLSVTGEKK